MVTEMLSDISMQNHGIKVTALVTAVACGSYMLWHRFIRDRPQSRAQEREQQLVRIMAITLACILALLKFGLGKLLRSCLLISPS